MATSKGKSEVLRFIANLPEECDTKLLRGAAREGAKVIANKAKDNTQSSDVRDAIKVRTVAEDDRIIGKIQVRGEGAYLAPWEEYGTDPHFISVDPSQSEGRSVRRINDLNKQARRDGQIEGHKSLVIGSNFVGDTVFHPGATPHPFLRPAVDTEADEALAAAQRYINSRVTPRGIVGSVEQLGDAE